MIKKAIEFAKQAHKGQLRKGKDTPYILHPLEVCAIVSLITDDEEVIAAAVLHDTVEDTKVTEKDLEREFGKRVAALVGKESEDKSRTLIERKMHTIKHLKDESIEVKMIALGDKLSNIRESYIDYLSMGDKFLQKFNEKSKVLQGMYYFGIAEALKEFKENRFYEEYKEICNKVYGDVKEEVYKEMPF